MNIDKRVLQYVQLRDEIKKLETEFEEKIAPYKAARDKLGALLLSELNKQQAESIRTMHGTLYKKSHKSASIVDKELFWNFVVEGKRWELIDKRANVQACADYIEEHKELPPGINYTNFITAGVRKST